MVSHLEAAESSASGLLRARFSAVRAESLALVESLEPEDFVVQSMPDVSPAKWHLAHVTWFFEAFVLKPFAADYEVFDEQFHFLFNSYYYSAGDMHLRPSRGMLTRPTVAEVRAYRSHVDEAMLALLDSRGDDADIAMRVELGLNHERQHQELLLTDIKHVLFRNPLKPAMNPALRMPDSVEPAEHTFIEGPEGIEEIGATGSGADGGFAFDNETPRHRVLLHPHRIGSRLITNGEYLEFMEDGGYENSLLWLSDGWAAVNEQGWNRPLYWSEDREHEFTLGGMRAIDLDAPVSHVSLYEADAFARWAGHRLPTEAEWEVAATLHGEGCEPMDSGNFADVEDAPLHPEPARNGSAAADSAGNTGLRSLYGDVWEWTSSPYTGYPDYRPPEGAIGEYNGKFMCGQFVLRGGSFATPVGHTRATYRNYYHPDDRWCFAGVRLAREAG